MPGDYKIYCSYLYVEEEKRRKKTPAIAMPALLDCTHLAVGAVDTSPLSVPATVALSVAVCRVFLSPVDIVLWILLFTTDKNTLSKLTILYYVKKRKHNKI